MASMAHMNLMSTRYGSAYMFSQQGFTVGTLATTLNTIGIKI